MRSRRVRRPALGIICAAALATSACFGGGPPAAQPTATTAATSASPVPASPIPGLPSPAPLASPGALPSPSPRPSGPEQSYTVESGDTLATIAQKFYGDSGLWRRIYEANRSAVGDNPDAIKVGTQLRIPPKE